MLKVGGGPDFPQEPLGAEHRGQLGPEHLDGDLAVVLAVVGQVDGGHAALAQLALDLVGIGQGGLQATEEIGHWPAREGKSQYRSPCARRLVDGGSPLT